MMVSIHELSNLKSFNLFDSTYLKTKKLCQCVHEKTLLRPLGLRDFEESPVYSIGTRNLVKSKIVEIRTQTSATQFITLAINIVVNTIIIKETKQLNCQVHQ